MLLGYLQGTTADLKRGSVMLRCPHAGDRGVVFALLSAELAVSTLDRTHMRRNSSKFRNKDQDSESSPLQRIPDHQHLAVCHGPITMASPSQIVLPRPQQSCSWSSLGPFLVAAARVRIEPAASKQWDGE